jgi:hypothetical protein
VPVAPATLAPALTTAKQNLAKLLVKFKYLLAVLAKEVLAFGLLVLL